MMVLNIRGNHMERQTSLLCHDLLAPSLYFCRTGRSSQNRGRSRSFWFRKVKQRSICARDTFGGEPGSLSAPSLALAHSCVRPVAFPRAVVPAHRNARQTTPIALQAYRYCNSSKHVDVNRPTCKVQKLLSLMNIVLLSPCSTRLQYFSERYCNVNLQVTFTRHQRHDSATVLTWPCGGNIDHPGRCDRQNEKPRAHRKANYGGQSLGSPGLAEQRQRLAV